MPPLQQLNLLLERWRHTPHPQLSERIYVLGNSFPELPYLRPADWIACIKHQDPAQLSPLLAQIRSNTRILHERLNALQNHPADPRIGSMLVDLMENPTAQLTLGNPTRCSLSIFDLIEALLTKHTDEGHHTRLRNRTIPPVRQRV